MGKRDELERAERMLSDQLSKVRGALRGMFPSEADDQQCTREATLKTTEQFFDLVIEACEAEGIPTEHRWETIQRYAVTYGLWWECLHALRHEGQIVKHHTAAGLENKRNPRMIDFHQLSRSLAAFAAELGLSPKARQAVETGQRVRKTGDGPIVYRFGAM